MALHVWIVDEDPVFCARVTGAWRDQAGSRAEIRRFADAAEPLSLLWAADPGQTRPAVPDLVGAGRIDDSVTDLLLQLRRFACVDVMFFPKDPSPALFSRALELGACDYLLRPVSDTRIRLSAARYLERRKMLSGKYTLTQQDIDSFFLRKNEAPSQRPQQAGEGALSDERLMKMLLYVCGRPEGTTASEAALAFRLSRVSARRRLNRLAELHWVKAVSRSRGKRGRPVIVYVFIPSFH